MKAKPEFIPEIQGLRTLAIFMIAVYHIWFNRVSGGVDVFLMVSAFLITLSLYRRSEAGHPVAAFEYIVRRFVRLLPPAAMVILFTTLASWLIIPAYRWGGILEEAQASMLYAQNWLLRDRAVDYYATDHSQASPLQHFWSLSLQGQVFIMYPLLHVGAAAFSGRTKIPLQRVLLTGFGVIFFVSLAVSMWMTEASQQSAYFETSTRLWEFAAGSLLALVYPRIRINASLRSALSWVGLAGMLLCGLVIQVEGSFPGYAALWPICAAGLIIISAGEPTRFGIGRMLSHGILHRLGRYSYALYLTHWPVLVLYLVSRGKAHANFGDGLVILLISALFATCLSHLIESPTKRFLSFKGNRSLGTFKQALAIIATALIALAPIGAAQQYLEDAQTRTLQSESAIDLMGRGADFGESVSNTFPHGDETIIPSSLTAKKDWVWPGPNCSDAADSFAAIEGCNHNGVNHTIAPRSVFVIGSSHAQQFAGMILPKASINGWSVRTFLWPGCPFATENSTLRDNACKQGWRDVTTKIFSEKPDAVVIVGTVTTASSERIPQGLADWISSVTDSGVPVVAVRDNPRFVQDMFGCGQSHGPSTLECNVSLDWMSEDLDSMATLAEAGAVTVDLTDKICPEYVCRPAVGGVLTYLDDNHISQTYAKTLAADFERRIVAELPWWQ